MTRVAVLFSGGKDSTRTIHWCLKKGFEVTNLVTIIPEREDSWMYHVPNINLVEELSKVIGIPLIKKSSSGLKEKEVEDMKNALKGLNIDAVACGGIKSIYQKKRIEEVCDSLNLELITPFWYVDEENFLENTISLGFEVRFVGVYSMGFDKSWLGRKLDEHSLKDLIELNKKYGVNLVGEGGEYETIVLDGPIFSKGLIIEDSEIIWDDRNQSGWLKINKLGFK